MMKFHGLCYSPFQADQNPMTKIYPSLEQIREDLILFDKILVEDGSVKIYGAGEIYQKMASMIWDRGWHLIVSGWLDKNKWQSDKELDNIVRVVRRKLADRVCIGDMVLSHQRIPFGDLIKAIKYVKARVNQPISSGNHWQAWLKYPALMEYVDFLSVGIYAHDEGIGIENALEYLDKNIRKIQKINTHHKPIIIDSGWPSGGKTIGKAIFNLQNQRRYLKEFKKYCQQNHLEYLVFEAFDEKWKSLYECDACGHFGLYSDKRILK